MRREERKEEKQGKERGWGVAKGGEQRGCKIKCKYEEGKKGKKNKRKRKQSKIKILISKKKVSEREKEERECKV